MSRRLEQATIIAAMVLGSVLLWTAVPALWLWIAGRFSRVSQSDMTSLAIVIIGIPTTMVLGGLALGRLDRRYTQRFGTVSGARVVGARWLHSLRGGSDSEPVSLLDKILIVNVAVALLLSSVWFALFSTGSQTRH